MSFLHLIRLVLQNLKYLLLIPMVLAASVYYFTRNEKKVYSSESVVYTGIASGYTLNGSNRADYFATSNAFDNLLSIINSRETKQEVVIQLLAEHLMLKAHNPADLGWDAFNKLSETIPDSIRTKLVRGDLQATINAINDFLHSSGENMVYELLNSAHPFYSLSALQSISAQRLNSSDLIKISYITSDAAICKRTLELLEEIFMRKHKLLREGQTESVIAYFESETKKSYDNLEDAEQAFLNFSKGNDIINYYEQTKAVAGEKENLYSLAHVLDMDRMASGSALEKINKNLEGRAQSLLNNSNIINQREELAKLYNNIAVYEAIGETADPTARGIVDSLKRKSSGLEKNLKATLDQHYVQTTTPEGIPSKEVLDQWLKTTIAFEQGKARLAVMDNRKKEFREEYRKFAPLGAMLKKIERKISVAEQAYLEMLHGLNLARLTQQNNELTSKLTVVDPPYLPLKPNPSTRKLMVAVSFLAGFIVVLAILLTRFLLNRTLQEPRKAEKKLGLPLLGVYPIIQQSTVLTEKANLRLLQQVLSVTENNNQSLSLGLISMQTKEGKTEIAGILQRELKKIGYSAAHVQWKQETQEACYDDHRIRLFEIPALDNYVYTANTLPQLDQVFVVCRANRIWTQIDKGLLENFNRVTGIKSRIILNGVDIDFAEAYIGEAPKNRTFFRALIKRLAKFEFGNRKRIGKNVKQQMNKNGSTV